MKWSAGPATPSARDSGSTSCRSARASRCQDTFYVLEVRLRLFLRDPKEEIRLEPGETYTVRPRRAHLVTNGGETSAVFLVLQGLGEYDYVPLT